MGRGTFEMSERKYAILLVRSAMELSYEKAEVRAV